MVYHLKPSPTFTVKQIQLHFMMKKILLILFLVSPAFAKSQSLYFPPLIGTNWDTVSPASLGWCANYLDTLDNLLLQRNTKAIIILKDGKIAHETYFGTFTVDSNWYWASAGKTLTAFNIGQAQEQNYLSINDSTSHYLDSGWTSAPANKEGLITIRNQLTMTSGLDDGVSNESCTLPSCLQYLADAGTRWAYHNAPYTLLQDVLDSATGNFTNFFNTQLRNRIGMNGLWFTNNVYNYVYHSKPRSMARFGLLMLNRGVWNTDTLMHDSTYYYNMINTSQNLNLSYGYLWWLNGKSTFMLPNSQFTFNGSIIPNAPTDMYCALGKNDQKIHVIPSQNLVVIRMGDSADTTSLVPTLLDNEMWDVLNKVFCNSTSVEEKINVDAFTIYPNPFENEFYVSGLKFDDGDVIKVYDVFGREILSQGTTTSNLKIQTSKWQSGIYFVKVGDVVKKVLRE